MAGFIADTTERADRFNGIVRRFRPLPVIVMAERSVLKLSGPSEANSDALKPVLAMKIILSRAVFCAISRTLVYSVPVKNLLFGGSSASIEMDRAGLTSLNCSL